MTQPNPIEQEIAYEGGTMISETDLKGTITFCNRRFAEMCGYETREIVGRSHNFLRHPDMPKAVFQEMWETIETGEPWKGYIKNLRKDGSYYWAVVRISQTQDESGTPKGYIAVREIPGPQTLVEVKERYQQMRDTQN